MDKQSGVDLKEEKQPLNGQPKITIKEEVSVTVKKTREKTNEETVEEAEEKYREAMKKYEDGITQIKAYGQELKELFHKSQDTFEKQLSYISAGALALSVGFIKDIVHPIKDSNHKWILLAGWGLLISTLLLNLVSHILAGKYAKKGARETEDIEKAYDPIKIEKRAKRMDSINWTTVGMLSGGIILVVLYITFNAIL
jgi:hypothetical protein